MQAVVCSAAFFIFALITAPVSGATTLSIPRSIQAEHEHIHHALVEATKIAGPVGAAARELADVLHPHFVREEEFALPPLGLLERLAREGATEEMAEALPMTQRLKTELPQMLAEHKQIVGALEELRKAARAAGRPEVEHFAEALVLHAQTEEQVTYPTALLIGDYLKLKLGP